MLSLLTLLTSKEPQRHNSLNCEGSGTGIIRQAVRLIVQILPGSTADNTDRRCTFSSDSSLTQEFVEEVKDVLPRQASLFPCHLSEVGGAVVQVHPVDALGQQG